MVRGAGMTFRRSVESAMSSFVAPGVRWGAPGIRSIVGLLPASRSRSAGLWMEWQGLHVRHLFTASPHRVSQTYDCTRRPDGRRSFHLEPEEAGDRARGDAERAFQTTR